MKIVTLTKKFKFDSYMSDNECIRRTKELLVRELFEASISKKKHVADIFSIRMKNTGVGKLPITKISLKYRDY